MKHHLSKDEWVRIWSPTKVEWDVRLNPRDCRYQIWYNQFKTKYNLEYEEVHNGPFIDAWLYGEEKDINWFLLSI